jgi:hypothetical protein
MGLDGVKLVTGAYMGTRPVVNMDVPVAKAAVEIAHAQDKPAFAHPRTARGWTLCWRRESMSSPIRCQPNAATPERN